MSWVAREPRGAAGRRSSTRGDWREGQHGHSTRQIKKDSHEPHHPLNVNSDTWPVGDQTGLFHYVQHLESC